MTHSNPNNQLLKTAEKHATETGLEESEHKYQALFENAGAGIGYFSTDGIVFQFNKVAAQNLGGKPEDFVGKSIIELVGNENGAEYLCRIKRVAKTKTNATYEDFVQLNSGKIWLLSTYSPLMDTAQKLVGIQIISHDITDQKLAEAALREAQWRLLESQKTGRIGHVEFNVLTGKTIWAEVIYDLYERDRNLPPPGYDEILALHAPEDAQRLEACVKEAIESARPYKIDLKANLPGKKIAYYHAIGTPVADENGRVTRILGTVQDVTEQRKTENALRESEERFNLAMQAANDGLWDWNPVTHEIYYSPGWKRMLGYSDDELENEFSVWETLTHPEDVKKSFSMLQEHLQGKKDRFEVEFRMKHKDGHWVEILSRANAIFDKNGEAVRVVGTHVDISRRKKTEKALQESQSQLAAILENTSGSLWAVDSNFQFILGNSLFKKNYLAAFGNKILPGDDVLRWIDDDELAEWKNYYQQALAGKWFSLERKRKYTDKQEWTEYRFSPILAENSVPVGAIVLANDISDRKRAEAALQQAQANLEEAQKIARIGSWEYDIQNDTLISSEMIFIIFEEASELKESNWAAFESVIHPDDWPVLDMAVQRAITDGIDFDLEFRILTRQQKSKWGRGIGKVIKDKHGEIVKLHGTIQDITKQKNLEAQLRHAQKMDAIGKLAGGVAHDFNNLLTVINGYSDLLLSEIHHRHPLYQDLQQIRQAGLRAASLTRQLLAFSRKQVLQPEMLNVNHLLNNVERMLQRLIGEDIELQTYLDKDLADVIADRGQLEQIIVNLAVNARDAMPRGGKLTIKTRNIYFDAEFVETHANAKIGNYVQISMTDNGIGMDKTIQSQIFEPFFTTKDTGKGTGLGLSTVYGIVKQSGGHITVYSEPGKGATFEISLPALKKANASIKENLEDNLKITGTETILIVEDEKSVLSLIVKTLKKCGYHLLTATDGIDALEIARKHKRTIHLLLSDVVMPNMSGKELSQKMVARHPETVVCFMSGYTDDAIVRHGVLDQSVYFIQKPFSPQALSKKVREILDAAGKYE